MSKAPDPAFSPSFESTITFIAAYFPIADDLVDETITYDLYTPPLAPTQGNTASPLAAADSLTTDLASFLVVGDNTQTETGFPR